MQSEDLNGNNFEVHSDEYHQVLGKTPSWMISWGTSLIFSFVFILLFLSWFIKYPDTIKGSSILSTENPPIKLIAKVTGYISNIYVADSAKVSNNKVIAELEGSISTSDVSFLENLIEKTNSFLTDPTNSTLQFDESGRVFKEIQNNYNELQSSVNDYRNFITDNNYGLRIQRLKNRIDNENETLKINLQKLRIAEKLLDNARIKYEVNEGLFKKGVISKMDWIAEEEIYLNAKQNLENAKLQVIRNRSEILTFKTNLEDRQYEFINTEKALKSQINLVLQSLKAVLNQWQQKYLIMSPINGRVSFSDNWVNNQYVQSGVHLFTIVPQNTGYMANVLVSEEGFGKIEQGQKVRIKLKNYPFEQYGYLVGSVEGKTLIPDNGFYRIRVKLQNSKLITNYGNEIKYAPEMKGEAEIITEDLRLIERVFLTLNKLSN